ncbi:hypothetical protein [Bacillus cereus group sp. MG6]|uniref:hypothetical protein n=1 Tax=Bacillus cereus group sp. MG6 TaxID=3040246 RepID=UPI003393C3D3
MRYFKIAARYEQNGELFEHTRYMCTQDDLEKVMDVYTEVVTNAYKEVSKVTHCHLISVIPTEVSEIEYKRHALSPSGKRDLNSRKRGN